MGVRFSFSWIFGFTHHSMRGSSSTSSFPYLLHFNITLETFLIFLTWCENMDTESYWNLYFTIINSASFSATGGTCGFLKYGLVVLYTLSSFGTKGLRCAVLRKEVVGISSLFMLLLICQACFPFKKWSLLFQRC